MLFGVRLLSHKVMFMIFIYCVVCSNTLFWHVQVSLYDYHNLSILLLMNI